MKKKIIKLYGMLLCALLLTISCHAAATINQTTKTKDNTIEDNQGFILIGFAIWTSEKRPYGDIAWTLHPVAAARITGGPLNHRHILGPFNLWFINMKNYTFEGKTIDIRNLPESADHYHTLVFVRGSFTPSPY